MNFINFGWGVDCNTVCPRSSDPFYVVTYYIKLVTSSRKYSIISKKGGKSIYKIFLTYTIECPHAQNICYVFPLIYYFINGLFSHGIAFLLFNCICIDQSTGDVKSVNNYKFFSAFLLCSRLPCTVCPSSTDPFYVVTYYIIGHYFLDTK